MKKWIVILLLVIIGLLLLNYFVIQTNGLSVLNLEMFVNPSEQTVFTEEQAKFFNNEISKGIYVNPGLLTNEMKNTVDNAFATTDLTQAKSTELKVSDYLTNNPIFAFRAKDAIVCGGANHPSQLSRPLNSKYGCGWFFVPDGPGDNVGMSIGAFGGINGPVDTDIMRENPTGKWIWNLTDAAKMEDIKKCKRVKICEANVAGCGWCVSKGHSVPINDNGTFKYTDSDAQCNEATVMKGRCSSVRKPAVVDKTIDSNGNLVSVVSKPETNICDAVNGKLSRNCLKLLALASGCGSNGALMKMIVSGSKPSQADQVAIDILAKNNVIVLGPSELGNGDLSIDRAMNAYGTLVSSVKTGRTKQIKDAAKYLSVGGAEVDLCDVGGDSYGPFNPICLSQAFREAGCQMSGEKAPKSSQDASGFTWNGIKTSYRELARNMKSPDGVVQQKAIKDCLGSHIITMPGVVEKCKE